MSSSTFAYDRATMVAMPVEPLRVGAYCVYLGAWVALALAAIAGALPRRSRRAPANSSMSTVALIGMLLQGTAALPISLSLPDGPLRPGSPALIATMVLSPFAVVLFVWALWSARNDEGGHRLITAGPYAWLRHPMYLAFLAMLLATGLLVSARVTLFIAIILYVVGSELRIAVEEAELAKRFPADYADYRRNTRWLYLPGVR